MHHRSRLLICWLSFLLLCFAGVNSIGQETDRFADIQLQLEEAVDFNEQLRAEITAVNLDLDRLRSVQRWLIALVAVGAFGLGFVGGYIGRLQKEKGQPT